MELCAGAGVRGLPSKRSSEDDGGTSSQQHTQEALRELFQQVSNMPESTKKKKLIRQVTQRFAHLDLLSWVSDLEKFVQHQLQNHNIYPTT